MPLDYVAASDPQSAHSASEHRRVLVVACGTSPSRMPEPALAALAAADVVFHDANFDPAMLALIPRGAFVEPVSSCGDRVSAQTAAIARADKLTAEGWRVVWLICGSDATGARQVRLPAATGLLTTAILGIPKRKRSRPEDTTRGLWRRRSTASPGSRLPYSARSRRNIRSS